MTASTAPKPAPSVRRRLYVFSPLPPQRNGLADYLMEYLEPLARDFDLHVVAEAGSSAAVRQRFSTRPEVRVLDEAEFLARQPDPLGQTLYNVGNNGDCAYLLDHLHRFPGVVIVHDISLFYLHQVAAQRGRLGALLGRWLKADGYTLPEDFLGPDGSPTRTPGLVYQECLMLRRIATSARGLMVHTAYAERRLRGSIGDVPLGEAHGKPLARIPHFVLPSEPVLGASEAQAVLERYGIQPQHFLALVPGFLTGNKMLYEIMAAVHSVQAELPGLKLVFAGEERPDEYPVSQRVAMLWPGKDRPVVTGYLDADELDVLLTRADLSFVLRFPTYGESSGILPRAAAGGGDVVTVEIGAYPEFESPAVTQVSVGGATVSQLAEALRRSHTRHQTQPASERTRRQADERQRSADLTPAALYPRLRALLDATWEAQP